MKTRGLLINVLYRAVPLTIVLLFAVACVGTATPAAQPSRPSATPVPEQSQPSATPVPKQSRPSPTPTSPPSLTLEDLQNAEYQGIYEGQTIKLTDGKYEGEPFVEGGASRPTIILTPFYAFGDLNGDGVADAVVVLVESSGGSGSFVYLAAVLDQNGQPSNVATQLVGDRVQVDSITIDAGQITLTTLTHGPDDPMCCPSQKATLVYELQGDSLVKVSEEPAQSMAEPGFAGTYTATLPAASSPGRDITLNLNADGTIEMSTDYLNGEPPIVEMGTWEANADGTATVTLTGRADSAYDEPVVITFELQDDQLVAVDYDVSLFGSEGLTLTRAPSE